MSDKKNYITPQGFEALRKEYSDLLNVERPKIVEMVAWAASNGDRSENADYIYGKRRMREIDKRLRFLQSRLEIAEVVNPAEIKADKIVFGATVEFENEEGEDQVFQIVGEDEWDVKQGKISWQSPLAKALLGKKEDDEVQFSKPNGSEILLIKKITYK